MTPLFPLQSVLFPGGLLNLKIFEARYLDMITGCLREQQSFGVIAIRSGSEVHRPGSSIEFESTGTLAALIDVDSTQVGILQVRCKGLQRFAVSQFHQQGDGLWLADSITLLDDDLPEAPDPASAGTVQGLVKAIETMAEQGATPFFEPYRFDDAGWVANRWCELLPISLAAKQKLLELPDPQMRLKLIDDFLRSKGVVRDE